jgi:hypothetical protein
MTTVRIACTAVVLLMELHFDSIIVFLKATTTATARG